MAAGWGFRLRGLLIWGVDVRLSPVVGTMHALRLNLFPRLLHWEQHVHGASPK